MSVDLEYRELKECPKCHTKNFRVFYKPTGKQGYMDNMEVAGYRCRNKACGHVEYVTENKEC